MRSPRSIASSATRLNPTTSPSSPCAIAVPPPRERSVEHVRDEAVGELRIEPGGLWRHHLVGIRDRYQVLHPGRIKRERRRHRTGMDAPLELRKAAAAADEVDAGVGAQVADA